MTPKSDRRCVENQVRTWLLLTPTPALGRTEHGGTQIKVSERS